MVVDDDFIDDIDPIKDFDHRSDNIDAQPRPANNRSIDRIAIRSATGHRDADRVNLPVASTSRRDALVKKLF